MAMEKRRWFLSVLAYLVPTFALGFVWHLVVFDAYYKALEIYRDEVIIPFGFATIILQGVIYGWIYGRVWAGSPVVVGGLRAGIMFSALSWSYMVLAVAAKFPMASLPGFITIETAFTLLQFAIYGPLVAWVWRQREAV